jgi:hypothetical protein
MDGSLFNVFETSLVHQIYTFFNLTYLKRILYLLQHTVGLCLFPTPHWTMLMNIHTMLCLSGWLAPVLESYPLSGTVHSNDCCQCFCRIILRLQWRAAYVLYMQSDNGTQSPIRFCVMHPSPLICQWLLPPSVWVMKSPLPVGWALGIKILLSACQWETTWSLAHDSCVSLSTCNSCPQTAPPSLPPLPPSCHPSPSLTVTLSVYAARNQEWNL